MPKAKQWRSTMASARADALRRLSFRPEPSRSSPPLLEQRHTRRQLIPMSPSSGLATLAIPARRCTWGYVRRRLNGGRGVNHPSAAARVAAIAGELHAWLLWPRSSSRSGRRIEVRARSPAPRGPMCFAGRSRPTSSGGSRRVTWLYGQLGDDRRDGGQGEDMLSADDVVVAVGNGVAMICTEAPEMTGSWAGRAETGSKAAPARTESTPATVHATSSTAIAKGRTRSSKTRLTFDRPAARPSSRPRRRHRALGRSQRTAMHLS